LLQFEQAHTDNSNGTPVHTFSLEHLFMTAAHQAPSSPPVSFEIKSANLPLVALLLKTANLQVLTQDLAQRFGDIPDFFDNDPLVIDLTPLTAAAKRNAAPADAIDFKALLQLLASYKIKAIALRGGTPEHMDAGLACGLLPAPDARVVASASPAAEQTQAESPAASPAPAAVSTPPETPLGAMVISRPLRSGQQVYARGRDLVIMAMVNAGAEVIADGHIHVYAPLRGKAMAGARGNTEARIFALSLEAELISIAGIYRTSDVALPAHVRGKPAMVSLQSSGDGDKLVMEALA
jgi:septum site-determining protein MinC